MTVDCLGRTLRAQRHHFAPFFVLGDPDPRTSVEMIVAAVKAGATMLELGLPFSDPCADGPDIQAACERALQSSPSTDEALSLLLEVHERTPDCPKNLLVYGNLVHARGIATFCRDAAQAGASSLLVPDIPLEESAQLRLACEQADLATVFMAGPETTGDRLRELDAAATGFLYLAAYLGTTGRNADDAAARRELVSRVTSEVCHPVCLGFGLSSPEHLQDAFQAGAHIAVVGSALARLVAEAHAFESGPDHLITSITNDCHSLAAVAQRLNLPEN